MSVIKVKDVIRKALIVQAMLMCESTDFMNVAEFEKEIEKLSNDDISRVTQDMSNIYISKVLNKNVENHKGTSNAEKSKLVM